MQHAQTLGICNIEHSRDALMMLQSWFWIVTYLQQGRKAQTDSRTLLIRGLLIHADFVTSSAVEIQLERARKSTQTKCNP